MSMSMIARITIFIQKACIWAGKFIVCNWKDNTTTFAIHIVALSTSFKYIVCGTKLSLIFYWGWQWCIMGTEWHSASLYNSNDMLKTKMA